MDIIANTLKVSSYDSSTDRMVIKSACNLVCIRVYKPNGAISTTRILLTDPEYPFMPDYSENSYTWQLYKEMMWTNVPKEDIEFLLGKGLEKTELRKDDSVVENDLVFPPYTQYMVDTSRVLLRDLASHVDRYIVRSESQYKRHQSMMPSIYASRLLERREAITGSCMYMMRSAIESKEMQLAAVSKLYDVIKDNYVIHKKKLKITIGGRKCDVVDYLLAYANNKFHLCPLPNALSTDMAFYDDDIELYSLALDENNDIVIQSIIGRVPYRPITNGTIVVNQECFAVSLGHSTPITAIAIMCI